MISIAARRFGHCSWGKKPVQPVDPAFLFETGDAARSLTRLSEGMERIDAWIILNATRGAIYSCVYQSVYSEHFRHPLISSAHSIISKLDNLMAILFPSEGLGRDLAQWEIAPLQNDYAKFETILLSELQSISSYIVTRKGGFDIATMVNAGRVFFSKELIAKVPDALSDLDQAMRCIAFEVPTAAGFHLHRANESVLRVYWDHVTGGNERPKEGNMGVYLTQLNALNKGKKSVREHLKSIKDFHRNPLMHPEQSLDSIDEAIDLMAAIRCSIGYMLKEIPMPPPPQTASDILLNGPAS